MSVVAVVLGGVTTDTSGSPSSGTGWGKVALGVALIALAIRTWRRRPAKGEEPEEPGWMSKLDSLGAAGAFAGGIALSAVNPKNLLLGIAAGTSIASSDLSAGSDAAAIAVYSVLASVTVVAPLVVYIAARHTAEAGLRSARVWLVDHNAAVVSVVLLLMGAKSPATGSASSDAIRIHPGLPCAVPVHG